MQFDTILKGRRGKEVREKERERERQGISSNYIQLQLVASRKNNCKLQSAKLIWAKMKANCF